MAGRQSEDGASASAWPVPRGECTRRWRNEERIRHPPTRLTGLDPAPGRHSIGELVLHIACWKYAVRRRLVGGPSGSFPRSPSNWPAVPDPADAKAWKADRALLRDEHALVVEAIREFDPALCDDLAPKMTGSGAESSTTFGDLIMGVVMHDTYHTGQIQVLKRLCALRS